MAEKEVKLTAEGLKKLEDELEMLRVEKRKEIAERIKIARDFGDLSENAEYTAAKEEQAKMESRIAEIKKILENVVVIDEKKKGKKKVVSIGSTVVVHDYTFDEDVTYTIVGSMESNPVEFKISDESPIGKALLGTKPGDELEVECPGEIVKLKVLELKK